ncbi:MAG TPA: hypothetical protein VD816_18955, partial [Ohtaekwangia sp.]|nr:hypothetical protein [Ohtaekwangia sp.]
MIAKPITLLCCIFCLACSSPNKETTATGTLPADELKPFGRYTYSPERRLELISSAAHAGFTFEGKECRIFASLADPASHNYLQYELDGTYQKRVKISGSDNQPVTITATGEGSHTV